MEYGFSLPERVNGSRSVCAASLRLRPVDAHLARERLHVLGGGEPGAAAEDDQVGQRVAAEAIGAMHAAHHFTRREEAGHRSRLRVGVDPDCHP
jgi:hypothetical protein